MSRHPAATFPFRFLHGHLLAARDAGLVTERVDGPLRLYCYTKSCVYERAWDDVTIVARGLILDVVKEQVVAYPFKKFFNVGECVEPLPNLPFEVFEKLDGSLIIAFYHGGGWRAATKGSFDSEQARDAALLLQDEEVSRTLIPWHTYLFEWVGPSNRIVVPYEEHALVLLAVYDELGHEQSYPLVQLTADLLGWRCAKRHEFVSIADLVTRAAELSSTEEGFVVRFTDGTRVKVKGDEYRRIHALISRCTPLAVWEAMQAGDDLKAWRRELPEELWNDFDQICVLLQARVDDLVTATWREHVRTATWTDKEVGLARDSFSEPARSFIFAYRKHGDDLLEHPKSRAAVFRHVRPTGNRLDGYEPSRTMLRVEEEAL